MRPWLDGMHVPGRSPMRSGAGLGHHVPTVPRALGSGIARRRRIPAQCDHSFRPNVNACVAGRWLSFGLAPPIPGRVAPDWISPDLRPTTTAAHAARFVLGETPRSAARLHCSPVPECRVALGSRADRGGHRPLPGGWRREPIACRHREQSLGSPPPGSTPTRRAQHAYPVRSVVHGTKRPLRTPRRPSSPITRRTRLALTHPPSACSAWVTRRRP